MRSWAKEVRVYNKANKDVHIYHNVYVELDDHWVHVTTTGDQQAFLGGVTKANKFAFPACITCVAWE